MAVLSFFLLISWISLRAGATVEWMSRPYSRLYVDAGMTAKIDWKFPVGAKAIIYEYKISNTLKRGTRVANIFGNSPVEITKDYKGKIKVDDSGALSILNAGVADEGFYSITVTYKLTALTDEVEIKIQKAPTIISFPRHPKSEVYYRGISISLVCMAVGRPVPEVTWYKDDNMKAPLRQSSGSTVYNIVSASDEDTGKYTCLASNEAGKANRTIHFIIYRRPYDIDFVHDTALDGTIFEGETVTFTCLAKGSPAISTYRFLHNGRHIAEISDGVYKIKQVKLKHTGKYCCIPINKAGLGQNRSVVLNVKERPDWENHSITTKRAEVGGEMTKEYSTNAGTTEAVLVPSGEKGNLRNSGCMSYPSFISVSVVLGVWIMRWH